MSFKDNLDLNEFVCFALYSASRSMTHLYKTYLDPRGLTYPQFLVLFLLWKQDGRTVSEIGQTLLLDSGTITPLLKRLEARALLRRTRGEHDERVVQVFLTDAGRALEGTLEEVATGMLCDLELCPSEVVNLAARIHALRRTIESSALRRRPNPDSEQSSSVNKG